MEAKSSLEEGNTDRHNREGNTDRQWSRKKDELTFDNHKRKIKLRCEQTE